jgi:hypothetical protein
LLPELLEVRLSLLRSVIELEIMLARYVFAQSKGYTNGITLKQVIVETGKAQLAQIVDLWVQRLESVLLFLG